MAPACKLLEYKELEVTSEVTNLLGCFPEGISSLVEILPSLV